MKLFSRTAFVTVFVWLLVVATAGVSVPLLYKLGMRSVCYADVAGFLEAVRDPVPGGALRWCAGYGMSLWSVPWLGGGCFVAVGVGVGALWRWATGRWTWSFIPFAVVVWQVAYCGFSVWLFKDATFPLMALLTYGVVLFVAGAVRRWGAWSWVAVALYPWVGMGALVGVVLGSVARWRRRICFAVGSVVVAVAMVAAYQRFSFADPAWSCLLMANLPLLAEADATLWNCASCTVPLMFLVAQAVLPCRAVLTSWALAALFLVSVWFGMDRVSPLYDLLRCERALAANDLRPILELSETQVQRHRMLMAYWIYAQWQKGKLSETLFEMSVPVSHEKSTIEMMELDGYTLLYHYGLVQLARRWCYESVINKGWSGDKYALLARCALICDEPALAMKSLEQLKRIPFRRAEAERLERLDVEKEMRIVAERHRRLCADSGSPVFEGEKRLESGIYNRYAVLKNGSPEMIELYLCASLLRKDTKPFLENYDVILKVWQQRPLPKAFQQALLAAAAEVPPEQQPHLTDDLFSPETVSLFMEFRQAAPNAAQSREAFYQKYRHSYWFYALFVP
ncbi:MAG: DUF6057 family protein [Kiritimatiellia bacterium]